MIEVTVTAANRDAALKLARAVLEERLAACANVTDYVTSLYWWDDKLQHDQEAVITFKTSDDRADALSDFLVENHSYDMPAIIRHAVSSTSDYEAWVDRESKAR